MVHFDRRRFLQTAAGTGLVLRTSIAAQANESDAASQGLAPGSSIRDLRALPDGATLDADVCIIGAGAAGITLALELAGARMKVLLIESGGFEFDDQTQNLYAGEVVGHHLHDPEVSRLRYFGGTTNHWSGICRPLDALDFERRSWIADSGWPITLDALLPYYEIAHRYCQLGAFGYRPEDWLQGDDPGPLLPDGRLGDALMRFSPPTRFGEAHREQVAAAPDVEVYLHANLVRWNTSEDGNTVHSIDAAAIDGPVATVSARWFVLATGGIENARLLLQPAPGHPNGVGNGTDLVGRYFADHAYISRAATVVLSRDVAPLAYFERRTIEGVELQRVLLPDPATQEAERLLNCHLWLAPGEAGTSPAITSYQHLKQSLREFRWPKDLGYHTRQVLGDLDAIWSGGDVASGDGRVLFTEVECEVPPDRDSRVMLSDEVDDLGLRRVTIDWRVSADLYQTVTRVHEILGEDLARANLGKVEFAIDEAYMTHTNYGDYHHMGTTRMHDDPKRGVVDRDCRVHGVGNLFVAGSSVYPTYGHANPTLTLVALAARLADHLRQRAA